ncbi:hypothetical protein BB560_005792 [Smittium megazygosporum]|uniref:HORMA domain-containing protein n=1 Tax=Smittium megazygosporum TaxID=133381 RepID=A0A2T9YWL9_9FUNG|nr:hypothetical protein BB560_005792 [Smittium megazygosporum]
MQQAQVTKGKITLKGSAKIITEFFGIYPSEDFKIVQKYGLNMLVTTDLELRDYIKTILQQVEQWLLDKSIKKLVMAINSTETRETLERWQFDIHLESQGENAPTQNSSVTFLPMIDETCTFNILVYADKDVQVPSLWVDSNPHHVKNSEQVRLRSFSTDVHKVDAMVAYRRDPDLC